MDLYKEILINLLKDNNIEITFKGIEFDYNKLLEDKAYLALDEIKKILANDTIDNENCLKKINEIVSTYKSLLIPQNYDFNAQK